MRRLRGTWLSGVALLALVSLPAGPASADLDACSVFSNIDFESGNLSGWTLTAPNADYILTPNASNPIIDPVIDPADVANNPATLGAPAGAHFTGVKRPLDTGPDFKYKLAHNATTFAVAPGTTIQVKVWANRGRLEPYDTPASTADLLVKIFGWSSGSTPTVNTSDNWSRTITWNPASQSFTSWAADGAWASQTFTFTSPATALAFLSISIAGRTNNHDQYVAVDMCDAPTPSESSTWGSVKQRYR